MEEYLGLLVSITEGLQIPKKKVFLSVYRLAEFSDYIDSVQ